MIQLEPIGTESQMKDFYSIGDEIYESNINSRSTEIDMIKMLVEKKTVFYNHATIYLYLIKKEDKLAGRFALVNDQRLKDYVEVAFFESIESLDNISELILAEAKKRYPNCTKIVIGLNCHLNYGAGFLANRFDEPPLFGLSYTKEYYLKYFDRLKRQNLYSYRFENNSFFQFFDSNKDSLNVPSITIRFMDKKYLKRDIGIYTELNNYGFKDHPYWADRNSEEDLELFKEFSILLKNNNLLIAEDNGKPVGFLLWYPDFNQLVKNNKKIGLLELLRFKFKNPIDTVRLTEIGVLPEYRRKGIIQALIAKCSEEIKKEGYKFTEAGFIFEENVASIGVTIKMMEKALGKVIEPYRKFAVFSSDL